MSTLEIASKYLSSPWEFPYSIIIPSNEENSSRKTLKFQNPKNNKAIKNSPNYFSDSNESLNSRREVPVSMYGILLSHLKKSHKPPMLQN